VPAEVAASVAAEWNAVVDSIPGCKLPRCRERNLKPVLPRSVERHLAARIVEEGGFETFVETFRDRANRLASSAFHCGQNERNWRADLSWMLEPGGWQKSARIVIEMTNGAATHSERRYRKLTQLERDMLRMEGHDDESIAKVESGLTTDRSILTRSGASGATTGGIPGDPAFESGEPEPRCPF
jgi:hypothetical protein